MMDISTPVAAEVPIHPFTRSTPPLALFPKLLPQLLRRQRINHIVLREPAFARDARAQAQKTSVLETMRITVNDTFDPFAPGIRPKAPIHVEPHGAGVELDPGAGLRASIDHGPLIHFVRLALQQ